MGAHGLLAVGVPPQPLWLLYIKIAILVLSIIVLGLGAYTLSVATLGDDPGALDVFVALWSFITYGGAAAFEIWAPRLFYRIVALVLQILSIIFWLSAWAYSASVAAHVFRVYSGGKLGAAQSYGGALGGCAGLGAIVWVLTIVHLVFFIRACLMDNTAPGQAELGQVKTEAAPQQYGQQQAYAPVQQYAPQQPQQPYAPQQPYPQQPYPGQ
ncbi:hypothetical protein N657DRAFT_281442 [Parathielavia appendiculata]|uniref:MARVEL domain-containing protein n=1 Tax=Parathielavia appendiculata TaxID=2587402 RepID=A0AAN6U6D8_9PEZI|nr:hypothetical protein N657DRAFT_281442 [Parathielavia appendiculata]